MFHSDILKLLIPLELGSCHDLDLYMEGKNLDNSAERAASLLLEGFPDSTDDLLTSWERVYGLFGHGDSLQLRKARVIQKVRELGRLDRAYFISLAAVLGFQIVIQELSPFMAGWSGAGDALGDADSDWCWRVYYSNANGYYFRAGESSAGECLSSGYDQLLIDLFEELKPADTFIEFTTT